MLNNHINMNYLSWTFQSHLHKRSLKSTLNFSTVIKAWIGNDSICVLSFFLFCLRFNFPKQPHLSQSCRREGKKLRETTRNFTWANLYSFINMRHNTAVIFTFSLISFKYDWWYVLVRKSFSLFVVHLLPSREKKCCVTFKS